MGKAILTIAVIAAGLAGGAKPAPWAPPLTVCRILESPGRHIGETIVVEGYVIVGNHGVHLLEPGCDYEINLVRPEQDFPGGRAYRRVVDRLRSGSMMVRLRVRGEMKEVKDGDADNLLAMLGPYVELAKVEVLRAQRLSRREHTRYQDWLDDPGGRPFRLGHR